MEQELAKECSINIVPGTFVEKHVDDGKDMLYNVAYFISNEGEILGSYTKKNLWFLVSFTPVAMNLTNM